MAELEALRDKHPDWRFLHFWSDSTSEGQRAILATRKRDGLLVGGLTSEEVSAKISREEAMPERHGS